MPKWGVISIYLVAWSRRNGASSRNTFSLGILGEDRDDVTLHTLLALTCL